MKAITLHAPRDLRVETAPDPELCDPRDAIVRVTRTAICGSDLHVYHGRETGLDAGTVMGHEFVGVVVEAGPAAGFAPGDAVVSPFTTSCAACAPCRQGLTSRCEQGQLFGWVEGGRGLHGAQAEYVRVPLADTTLMALPADLSADEALLCGDVLATGFFCAQQGGARAGATVVVLGCGPVGLMAVVGARELGASAVQAVDALPERLALARGFGAEPLDLAAGNVAERVRAASDGRGADVVLEAVGSPQASRLAYDLVRPGGTIAAVGVHTEARFAFTPGEAYDKNLTYRAGRCPARRMMERVLPLAQERRHDLAAIVSHRLPLDEGPRGYELFDRKLEGCTKVVLAP